MELFLLLHKSQIRGRTLRNRLDGGQFKGDNGSSQLKQLVYFQSCLETFTRYDVVTLFRLTQEWMKTEPIKG